MIKKVVILTLLLMPLSHYGQDFSDQWRAHFSYYNVKDVSQGNDKIFAAVENAVFSYDVYTNEITTITTVNGLSGELISKIHYSETYGLLVVGYENGLIEIVFDDDDDVLTIVDIFDKPSITPTDKKINHFNEHEGLVYISTEYGISVYDLERLEFGDTYFIGDSGGQVEVNQTVVVGDYIYAACYGNRGLRKALVASNNLIDYQEWESAFSGDFASVVSNGSQLYTGKSNRFFYEIVGNNLSSLVRYNNLPVDVRSLNDNLIITTKNEVYVYDIDFNLRTQVSVTAQLDTEFTSATIDSEYLYIGTKDSGVIKTLILNPIEFEVVKPDGPLLNIPFSLKTSQNNLWVTYGDYTESYNPYPLKIHGFSHLKNNEWTNVSRDSVFGIRNLNTISINPFVENHVFISSFQDGILEVQDDVPIVLLNETNSGLESYGPPANIRQGGADFDKDGVLWTTTGRVEKALKSFNPSTGQWQGYSFLNIAPDPFRDEWGYRDLVIDNNGTKWMGGYQLGLIGYNESNSGDKIKAVYEESQNMPSHNVTAVAVDDRNQVWIGTDKGVRVLYNTSGFFTEPQVNVNEIIILEDGVAKELLFEQYISDIKVDGSNNKWIATIGAGLFYFSSDGQETIYHFTKENSPLPSNRIVDTSIDLTSGVVYIGTDKGLMSFKSGSSAAGQDLENAFVYPNPVRPTFNIVQDKVKIKDISENVNIKITDIEGNLVAEAESRTNLRYKGYNLEIDGGTAFWNGKNLSNNVVASGVYLIMLSDLDTFETKVLKVMVVR